MSISADELDVLNFFEVAPILQDDDVPWSYNDNLYVVEKDGLYLSFALAPAYKDVRLILERGGEKIYELNAVGVEDVRYWNHDGNELIEVVVSDSDSIRIKLKPTIQISHDAKPTIELRY